MSTLSLRHHSRGLALSPRRRRGVPAVVPVYTATPVNFDGLTYLSRGGPLSGVTASKVWSGSIWLRLDSVEGFKRAFNAASDRFSLLYFGGAPADYGLFGFDSGGTEVLRLFINFPNDPDTGWHHLLWSFDLADPAKRHFYLDDVPGGTWPVYLDQAIQFAAADLGIGANPAGNNKWRGDIADVWLRFGGPMIDFSIEANRRLFITAERRPANPAGWPAGAQVQLHGGVDEWHVNKGSGEGFTENGALLPGTGPVQLP